MPKVNIKLENKAENFDAIAPQKNQPVMLAKTSEKSQKNSFGKGLFIFLFFISAGFAGFLYWQNLQVKEQLKALEQPVSEHLETEGQKVSLIDRINQHILLPHTEQPEILTLSNTQDLKKQENFYEYAQDGDSLVKFKNLEIIYNPIADVIVNARTRGTVAGAETRAVQGAITLDIRNGSGVSGVAGRTADSFKGVKEFIVQNIGNAGKSDYVQTLIINLSSKDLTGLEKQFNTKAITEIPKGEKPTTADVVIIVGKASK